MYGVKIEKGPMNWQILQQQNGFAKVSLSGSVDLDEASYQKHPLVNVTVFDEDNRSRILPPQFCEIRDAKWSAELTLPLGGLYSIETSVRLDNFGIVKGERIVHIGVGDNFVITGQSNAVGIGKDMAFDESDKNVHLFRVSGNWDIATHPLHDTTNTKYPEFAETAEVGFSPWLTFAKTLTKKLGYPIGLIPATKGGIPISFWDRDLDGKYFGYMLNLLKDSKSGVAGVLWYQGCNDSYSDELRNAYKKSFNKVLSDFRKELGKDIPVFTVQLNKVTCCGTKGPDIDVGRKWFSLMREIQRELAKENDNVYMVPTIDLPVCDGIHNGAMSNIVLGQRVANVALKYMYGKSVVCDAPDIEKAVLTERHEVTLYFTNVYDRIFSDNNPIFMLPFSVTDGNGRILPDDYRTPGDNTIVLMFNRDIEGKATVSCDGPCEAGLMPYDKFTFLPVVMFDGVEIEK